MFLPGYPSTAAPHCVLSSSARSLSLHLPSQQQDREERLNNGGLHSLVVTCHADGGHAEKHDYRFVKCWKQPPDCTLCMFLHTEDSWKPASPTSSPAQSPSPATPVSLSDCDPRNASSLLKRSLDAHVTIEVAKDKPWRSLVHNFPPCALWSWGSSVPPHTPHSACVLARMVLVLQKQQFLDLHNTQKTYFLFMGTHWGPSEVTLWFTLSSRGSCLSMSPFVNSVAAPWILLLLSEKGLWQKRLPVPN